jgi:type IV pilus assembly protein PilE
MRDNGFTLVELMIVAALLAVVATVAAPIYGRYAERTFRAEAQADLLNCAQAMERYAAVHFDYVGADVALDGGALCAPRSVAHGRYRLTAAIPEPERYVLTATPVGALAGTGVLTYDSNGARTWNGQGSWEP